MGRLPAVLDSGVVSGVGPHAALAEPCWPHALGKSTGETGSGGGGRNSAAALSPLPLSGGGNSWPLLDAGERVDGGMNAVGKAAAVTAAGSGCGGGGGGGGGGRSSSSVSIDAAKLSREAARERDGGVGATFGTTTPATPSTIGGGGGGRSSSSAALGVENPRCCAAADAGWAAVLHSGGGGRKSAMAPLERVAACGV